MACRLAAAFLAAVTALKDGKAGAAGLALDAADAALSAQPSPDAFDAANVTLCRARALRLGQAPERALEAAVRALSQARQLTDDPDSPRLLVHCLLEVADCHREAAMYAPAGVLLDEALTLARHRLGEDDPDTGSAWNSLGMWLRCRGEGAAATDAYANAQSIYEKAADAAELASVLHNQASIAHLSGHLERAEELMRRALAMRAAATADTTPDDAVLAAILTDQGRFEQAAAIYQRAKAGLARVHGNDSIELTYLMANEAVLAHRRGRLVEATLLYATALTASEAHLGPAHPQTGVVMANSATLAADLGDPQLARQHAERARAILAGTVSDELPSLKLAEQILADGVRWDRAAQAGG
jgi:tetratricopeptide (TPR) repeat protein